jgi:hypothetical protein
MYKMGFRSRHLSRSYRADKTLFIAFVIVLAFLPGTIPGEGAEQTQKTSTLTFVREIPNEFGPGDDGYFVEITDLCCDERNNLYVVDSGAARIHKFDPEGKHLLSFGREGQGPGEFGRRAGLSNRITHGNDHKIYVIDRANQRISAFTEEGQFLFSRRKDGPIDKPAINSKGEMYLLEPRGDWTIRRHDKDFQPAASILERALVVSFPYLEPGSKYDRNELTDGTLVKVILKSDKLVVVSNFALMAYLIGQDDRVEGEFSLQNDSVRQSLPGFLKFAVEKGAFVEPFRLHGRGNDEIVLVYFNYALKRFELFLYRTDGRFLGTWVFPDDLKSGTIGLDNQGLVYRIIDKEKILVYRWGARP